MSVYRGILLVLHLLAIGMLILYTLLHVSEREGAAGIVGGTSEWMIKGGKGMEERIQSVTRYAAILFLITSFLLAYFQFF
ncbi:MAG: preprotein translocase subunit SecG [bacterium JZ-2024 1]